MIQSTTPSLSTSTFTSSKTTVSSTIPTTRKVTTINNENLKCNYGYVLNENRCEGKL